MTIGTSLHALTDFGHDVTPFDEALAAAADCGFASVLLLDSPGGPKLVAGERPIGCLLDFAGSDPELVKAALATHGLAPAGLRRACLAVDTEERVEASIRGLVAALPVARRLGTNVLMTNAGVAERPFQPSAEKQELLARVATVMRAVLAEAEPDVRLNLDLHIGAVVESLDDCRRLFDLLPDPRGGLTLNIGHLTTGRQEGWKLIAEAPERLHVIAWKDHLLHPPEGAPVVWSVELGTGDSPFEQYVAALKATPVDAIHLITFENVPLAEKAAALRRSREYLERLWAAA